MTKFYLGRPHSDRATFLYAGQEAGHKLTTKAVSAVRGGVLPSWLPGLSALDFLDVANPFFHTDRALFSMGKYLHGSVPVGMFSPRPGITILGDSGGFQFIGDPSLWQGDATRRWVLTALEHDTDEAMTLDIPTAAIATGTPWPDFNAALAITVDSLRFFDRYRIGRTRFLNVLQGRTRPEALAWYKAVKWFPAGGWAFGGVMREDFSHLADMLVRIADDGLLTPDRNRIHVLGMADLTAAVALSAIQRGLRARLGDDALLITFDVSTPSSMAGKARQAYGSPKFSRAEFGSSYFFPQTVVRAGRDDVPFAARHTSVGSRMTMGDLCIVKPGSMARTAWDGLSEEMLIHHNIEALLFGIDAANSIMELHPQDAAELAPAYVVSSYNALMEAMTSSNPLSYLRPYALDLGRM